MDPEMTKRLLPPAEWDRLNGTELEAAWRYFDPHTTQVLVVEEDGQIVGCWAGVLVFHAEGVYVAPAHRGRIAVARHLLTGMRALAAEAGFRSIVTASVSPDVDQLLTTLGADLLPGRHYVFSATATERKEMH